MSSKTEKMKEIRDELLSFEVSPLYEYRRENNYHPVVGQGNHDADILFIGEAPGKREAETAVPFCGRSGKLLDEFLAHINLERSDVYITNVVKDRPPANRDPSREEIALYTPFLKRQIEIIEPKVIVTLGRFAMEFTFDFFSLAEKIKPISSARGVPEKAQATYGEVLIFPLFHPAVALYNPNQKEVLQKDFEKLQSILRENS